MGKITDSTISQRASPSDPAINRNQKDKRGWEWEKNTNKCSSLNCSRVSFSSCLGSLLFINQAHSPGLWQILIAGHKHFQIPKVSKFWNSHCFSTFYLLEYSLSLGKSFAQTLLNSWQVKIRLAEDLSFSGASISLRRAIDILSKELLTVSDQKNEGWECRGDKDHCLSASPPCEEHLLLKLIWEA